jgi:hypothetical protein
MRSNDFQGEEILSTMFSLLLPNILEEDTEMETIMTMMEEMEENTEHCASVSIRMLNHNCHY